MTRHAFEECALRTVWITVDRGDGVLREPLGNRPDGPFGRRTVLSTTGAADVTWMALGSAVHRHHVMHVAVMALAGDQGRSGERLE